MSSGAVPEASGADASSAEASDRAERRRRLQALAGVTVHGSDGGTVGRVRDVYQQDAGGGELAAITVVPRQLSARSVLIPASAIAALPEEPVAPAAPSAATPSAPAPSSAAPSAAAPSAAAAGDAPEQGPEHVLLLLVDTATAKAGARPPLTLHATPQDLQAAAAALHLEEGSARA